MRRYIVFLTALLFVSCEMSNTKALAITILADRTDPIIPIPKGNDLHPLMHLEAYPNSQMNIRMQNIGNVDISPVYHVQLEVGSMFDNTLQRKAHIKRFYTEVDTLIKRENARDFDYKSSSVLKPLVTQLQTLANFKASDKHLILYSDLAEFSDIYNVYDYKSLLALQEHPRVVAEALKSKLEIPNLKGVTLHIVYYPKTNAQNRLFRQMLLVYRELFKSSGLQIHIGLTQSVTS